MKKTFFIILAFALSSLMFFSCSLKEAEETQGESIKETEGDKTETQGEANGEIEADVLVRLYLPNENYDGCVVKEFESAVPDGERLVSLLIKEGVLAEDVKLLSMRQEGDVLYLDMNEGFLDHLCTFGSSTEGIVMRCLTYSFMDAFGASQTYTTAEGKTISTGHVVYDFPIEMQK